jgi:bifunctional non-homologous end joining protein LigD
VAPELVCEVEFVEWTSDGILRAPSYKGLRDDKPATAVTRELKFTNLDKVLYPATGFTKGDLIDYYVAIADVLLPHLEGRALTLKRYPDGVEGKFFYEKNAPSHRPDWVPTQNVAGIDYVVVDSPDVLAWLGNLADLELHTPMARATAPDAPTMVAFDLDPGAPAAIRECCEIALLLNGMFEGLGMRSFAKTSGSKGLQVYLPVNDPGVTTAQAKDFARSVAQVFAAEMPERVVAQQRKTLREGKVLIDWSQNDAFKTTVTVYSPRARDRPTVSTPVTWDEVADAAEGAPLSFEVGDVRRRVAEQGDLFAEVLSLVQALPAAVGA